MVSEASGALFIFSLVLLSGSLHDSSLAVVRSERRTDGQKKNAVMNVCFGGAIIILLGIREGLCP